MLIIAVNIGKSVCYNDEIILITYAEPNQVSYLDHYGRVRASCDQMYSLNQRCPRVIFCSPQMWQMNLVIRQILKTYLKVLRISTYHMDNKCHHYYFEQISKLN